MPRPRAESLPSICRDKAVLPLIPIRPPIGGGGTGCRGALNVDAEEDLPYADLSLWLPFELRGLAKPLVMDMIPTANAIRLAKSIQKGDTTSLPAVLRCGSRRSAEHS